MRYAPRRAASATAGVVLFLVVLAGPAAAQDAPAPSAPPPQAPPAGQGGAPVAADLPEVVVYGERATVAWSGSEDGAPFTDFVVPSDVYFVPITYRGGRSVVSPEEVSKSGQVLLEEIVRRRPGIHVESETATDTKPNISVRGLDPQRSAEVTLLVDGIPLAPAPYGNPGQSLFPLTMERVWAVDMLRGGYSVPYGPNTVGGIVNFLTRPIPDEPMFMERVRVGSFDAVSTYTAGGGTAGNVGVLLEGVYTTGDTFRDNGHYEVANIGAKAGWRATDRLTFLFQFDWYDEDSDLSGGLNQAGYDADPTQSMTGEDYFLGDQVRGNLRGIYQISPCQRVRLLAYAYGGDRTFYLGRPAQYGATPTSMRATIRPTEVWAVQPEYEASGRLLGARHSLRVGVRYLSEFVKNRRVTTPWPSGAETVNDDQVFLYDAWSAWVTDTIEVCRGVFVTPGLRWEHIEIDGHNRLTDYTTEQDFDEWLPALSAAWEFRPDWSVYGNFQTSYRAPDIERIKLTAQADAAGQDLEGERARVYEAGVRGWWLCKGIFTDLTLFWIDFDDRFRADPTNFDVYFNTGHQRHRGVELMVDADMGRFARRLDGLHLYGAYHYVDTELLSGQHEGNHTRSAPPQKLSWGLRYEHPSGLWGGLDGCWVDESYADEANTKQGSADGMIGLQPSYSLWSARVGWQRTFLCDRMEVGLEAGVTNAFDEEYFYRRPGKGIIPGPERAFYGALNFAWRF